jgi:hypothetical protein
MFWVHSRRLLSKNYSLTSKSLSFPNLISGLIAGELAAERFMDRAFSCQRGHERLSWRSISYRRLGQLTTTFFAQNKNLLNEEF